MQPAINANAKSLLAKLLATENITIRQNSGAKTASFDVKNRVLELPIWHNISEDLNDMLIVHEVGHALDTPADAWADAIKKISISVYGGDGTKNSSAIRGFLNVVEDARIDKRQKRRYPGTRRNYRIGYEELFDRNFFETKGKDIDEMLLIDRLNMHFKGVSLLITIPFTSEEKVFLRRMDNTETFNDVVVLAEELFRFCKQELEEMQEKQKEMGSSLSVSVTINDDGEEIDGQSSSMQSDDKGKMGGDSSSSDSEQQNDDEVVPKSLTDEAYEKNREQIADNSTDHIYMKFPTPILKNILVDYKEVLRNHEEVHARQGNHEWLNAVAKEVSEFRASENATISFLVKEFEQRKAADMYARQSIAKTGVIDTNKLHSYRYNDDIFRRLTVVPSGKSHGFVMFIDWSGSMIPNLKYTVRQLMSLTMFCKRVQIPFEVYLFRDRSGYDPNAVQSLDETKDSNVRMYAKFILRNILSSRMNVSELNRAYTYLWAMAIRSGCGIEVLGGTPLNATILVADEVVNEFRRKSKVQIVNTIFLTDGESDPCGVNGVYSMKKKRYIIRDEKTKLDYDITDAKGGYDGVDITKTLLKMLKVRTGSNLIGFFLSTSGGLGTSTQKLNVTIDDDLQKCWDKNNYVPLTDCGYDDYYVISKRAFKTSSDEELNISSDMTKAAQARQFIKFSAKKTINRIMLTRFVDKITKMSMVGG